VARLLGGLRSAGAVLPERVMPALPGAKVTGELGRP
jgi:hypothetical protein